MNLFPKLLLLIATLTLGGALTAVSAPVTSGPVGFAHQVNKYLLDSGVDPVVAHQTGAIEISRIDGRDVITHWGLAPLPLPDGVQLDTIADSEAVVNVVPADRIQEGGKYRLKTVAEKAAEKAASPEGKLAAKRAAARASLLTELTAAGFTNSVSYVDDVNEWLETATLTAAQDKKITRLLSKYTALCTPKIRVDRDEE